MLVSLLYPGHLKLILSGNRKLLHITAFQTSDTPRRHDLSTFVSGGVEDCLFLDVMAPRKVFQRALANGTLAPVLVWIHGGGFTAGSKTSIGSALGLINRSQMNGSDGVIYVALNYRLGAFGFMSGPAFEEQGSLPNAGLHDQRLALEWIQQHIHKFG
ncbi:uncharacterized protein KD926_000814 [Aspergillus affinis]|uniref:uncharacterized protein n=1 Tax=Aspergillus affinis TaxID=1070780 RepID=UPI0022FEB228|nr:uncharacterized protein KD926_000814 [Aspergillus affinis]KAI9037166.1 hypothetical protein KD926_000814 [Aspergillus affinis]